MTPPELHRTLLDAVPSDFQQAFYASKKLGFSDKIANEEKFIAVAVLTLSKTMRVHLRKPERVVLFVAPVHDKWVVDQLDKIARKAFNSVKKLGGSTAGRAELAKVIGECFKCLFVGSRLLQLPEMPEAWTSFGFSKDDPIPDWMRDGLL
jgi:hypothetical protein